MNDTRRYRSRLLNILMSTVIMREFFISQGRTFERDIISAHVFNLFLDLPYIFIAPPSVLSANPEQSLAK